MADQNFRPFITEKTKRKPLIQKYAGFEIEKKWVLATKEQDYTKQKNSLELYNEVLEDGTTIEQGYIKDFGVAREMLEKLGIELTQEFRPNTVRLRKYGMDYILTLKDKKETKTREVEFGLSRKEFKEWWVHTKGARVYKKRLKKKVKKHLVEIDAFTDRFLLLAEIEVGDEKTLDLLPKLGMDVTNNSSWANKNLSK